MILNTAASPLFWLKLNLKVEEKPGMAKLKGH